MADAHSSWLTLHDHDVDHIYGLMDDVVRRFGEETMGDVWEFMVGGLFTARATRSSTSSQYSWEESLPTNLYLAMEAMRGHLVGPGRRGNFEFEEDEDRYTVRFDPCGSGGHIVRGDRGQGTPPRMEPPYNWAVLEEEHDFGWNKKGVCLYCTNCCVRHAEEANRRVRLPGPGRRAADLPRPARRQVHLAHLQGSARRSRIATTRMSARTKPEHLRMDADA